METLTAALAAEKEEFSMQDSRYAALVKVCMLHRAASSLSVSTRRDKRCRASVALWLREPSRATRSPVIVPCQIVMTASASLWAL